MNNQQTKYAINDALYAFSANGLAESAINLFDSMGYSSEKRLGDFSNSPADFVDGVNQSVEQARQLKASKALLDQWQAVHLLFQLTSDEIATGSQLQFGFETEKKVDNSIIHSYLFFAVQLSATYYTRTQLASITREINKPFLMPVMVLFRHGETLTLSIINRRLHKRDESKDVLEKVTLIKDINFTEPHRAHIEILFDLSLDEVRRKHGFTNFVELHRAWQKVLDSSELNKRFFGEIANWYFWAIQHVTFPKDAGEDEEVRNATSIIRLVTRLIFIWFIKEKGLVPDDLFDERKVKGILNYSDSNGSTYYKAILQNLFFATLNQEMNTCKTLDNRKFRSRNTRPSGRDPHYSITNLCRYESYFQNPAAAMALFSRIPFLNGGLFECLDKPDKDNPQRILRIDGFSDRPDNELRVPDFLFFSEEREVDLNEAYGTKNKRYKVRGLIDTFNRYKFTINENTPIEEEVALDPELLGKVFENLLANYNPETKTTARKQTGSYYTPREIVNYMVNESLIAYLETHLKENVPVLEEMNELPELLREVFAYTEKAHPFSEEEVAVLIDAIDDIKVFDPACGSGAFPMGILHKLVFILNKLDPHNERWKNKQLAKAAEIPDSTIQQRAITDIEEAFERNELDYGRKLYLIENCIYGVDIQPIAVQIAKLRFFISLVVDQKIDETVENRGIIPLPNLETKFVAANTLIGLDRPTQLVLRNPIIAQKEKELDIVRKQHFSARTLQKKRKCRQEDARLRAEISLLLKKDGLPNETTEKLAYWDPYDQNVSAEFFDSEWMFGVMNEFDVIIGNPPYIKEYTFREAFNGVRNSPYYKGKMDLWYLFACKSFDILREDSGVLCFIATNNWITNFGASILRNKVVSDATIVQLIDFGNYKIFESSGIQTMVLICTRNNLMPAYTFDLRKLNGSEASFSDVLDLLGRMPSPKCEYLAPYFQRETLRNQSFVFSSDSNELILLKLSERANFSLDGNYEVAQGILTPQDSVNRNSKEILGNEFEIGDGIFVLSDDEKSAISFSDDELKLVKPLYTTSQLAKYYGDARNSEWVIYTDSSFKNPREVACYPNIKKHLDKFALVMTSDNRPYGLHRSRNNYFFVGEKIISVRKCSEPTFTYTDFNCYVLQTFNVIKTNRINLKYLTALLNSRVVSFWLRFKGKMQGHQFQIDKEPLLGIPLIKPPPEKQLFIANLVDNIITAKRADAHVDVSVSEAMIDRLIYDLYGLTEQEIEVVQGSNAKDGKVEI